MTKKSKTVDLQSVALRCMAIMLLLACSAASAVELRDYYVTAAPADIEMMLANPLEDIYIDCSFEYNGSTWNDARIRLRGESSREYPKKSYKVNFDADNRFGTRDKINLISCWTDASFIREHLSYDLYTRAGLPASRTWFTRFFVNGEYWGLYLDVEQVDEHFLSYTDLPDDGTLYKADNAGALLSINENIAAVWEQETNLDLGIDALVELREWIDKTPAMVFDKLLWQKFDPDALAKVIAVNTLIGNQSTYYHNYYLLQDVYGTGKWTYLPWDMDNTFYFWDNYRGPHYYRSGHQSDSRTNPLISKCWESPGMRAKIIDQMDQIVEDLFSGGYYQSYIPQLHDLLYSAVANDTAKQFTIEEFESDLQALPNAMQNRMDAVINEIENDPIPFALRRSIRNSEGSLLHWTPSISQNGEPVTYELWIADNVWFTGESVTIIELNEPYYLFTNPPDPSYYFRVYAHTPSSGDVQSINYYEWVTNETEQVSGVFELAPVMENRTFSPANGPVLLPMGLEVEPTGSLTINPGTVLRMGAETSIKIHGSLSIAGTQADSVFIEPFYENHPWSSIFIEDPTDTVNLSFVSIRGGGVLYDQDIEGSMMHIYRGVMNVSDCRFREACIGAGGIAAWNTVLRIDHTDMNLLLESFTGELNWPDAVLTFGGAQTITDCRIVKTAGALYGGDLIDCAGAANTVIKNCVLENAGDDAIDFDYAYDAVLSGNYISGCSDNAMSLGQAHGFQVYNNIITDCANGIYAKEESEMSLYNNVLAFCGSGLRLDNADPPLEVIIRNCAFQSNTTHIDPDENQTVDAQYCAFSGDESYPGEGNISGDLRFWDVLNRDFRLRTTSPLIDAGWGTDYPEFDIRDSARVDIPDVANTGAGGIDYIDIGAFEFSLDDPTEPPPVIPESHLFVDNYPNPFNSWTTIRFDVVRDGTVELVIYDRLGRRVFGNVWHEMGAGRHTALWNAQTNSGAPLASGLYFVRLKQPAGSTTARMVLLR